VAFFYLTDDKDLVLNTDHVQRVHMRWETPHSSNPDYTGWLTTVVMAPPSSNQTDHDKGGYYVQVREHISLTMRRIKAAMLDEKRLGE